MKREVIAAFEHGVFLIADTNFRAESIPSSIGLSGVASSGGCIAVETTPDCDGDTRVVTCDEAVRSDSLPSLTRAFYGTLDTPSRRVHVFRTNLESLLSVDVTDSCSRVAIWTDHPREPSTVVILLGAGALV